MQYIVIDTPGQVAVREGECPRRQPGQALLRLLYGGLCGSDVGTYTGSFIYADYPRIPGHEFSAVIEEIDPEDAKAHGLEPGMTVTANPYFNCGECHTCKQGLVNCCMHNQTMGAQRDGAFCQYIVMPVERIYHGKGLDPKTLALVEPFCISYHAAGLGEIRPGNRVLVLGGGPIGLLAMFAAQMAGAQVTVADVVPEKLRFALECGAQFVAEACPQALQQAVEEQTEGKGFDVCFEAAGVPESLVNAVDAVAYRGKVVVVGVSKQNVDLTYSLIQKKELVLLGSRNALREDFLTLIDRLSGDKELEGRVQKLVTRLYPFRQAAEAFAHSARPQSLHIKTMLDFTS